MRGINLFTIPAGAAFADELARGVLKRYGAAAIRSRCRGR